MNTNEIVFAIDAEIAQLKKVKALLAGTDLTTKRKPGRPGAPNKATSFNPVEFAKKSTRRIMSAEGRARIAAAQRARWAESRKIAKKTASAPAKKAATAKAIARKTAQVKSTRVVKTPARRKAETAGSPAS